MRYLILAALALVAVGCAMDRQAYLDDTGAQYSRTLVGLGYRYDADSASANLEWNAEGGSAAIGKATEGLDTVEGFQAGVAATTGVIGQVVSTLGPAVGERISRPPEQDKLDAILELLLRQQAGGAAPDD